MLVDLLRKNHLMLSRFGASADRRTYALRQGISFV